ncbi:MAG: alpha-1,4-glucan--maltose-1-phosphate maltosyltransferase [Dehalococcoidia bacterium]
MTTHPTPGSEPPAVRPPRVIVDAVFPEIDGGRYPAKRTVGDRLAVRAHVFGDGHDTLAGVVRYRCADDGEWAEVSLRPLGNDEWDAAFPLERVGRYLYTVEAWVDAFTTWRLDLEKRVAAGWDVSSELLEGAVLVANATTHARADEAGALRRVAGTMADPAVAQRARVHVALDPELAERMARFPDRRNAARYPRELSVRVDRERARFGSWYELFPRSAGTDPVRGATLREAAGRLPDIAAMGFDVLYLPPIHPIGQSARKGPNNALHAGPHDPGSPWAIGAEAGGHAAVHPDLGTIDDFDWFVEEAQRHGIEIALDLAFQCSPDHPWVREHPEWFRHRADGTIKYAENPPKQYQDIYPLNFECDDWRGLWAELKHVTDFWIGHGVEIFRADNPHTKQFAFWEWLIAAVQAAHPHVIFLAEAFTRPKRLYSLAKLGFTQSYGYFTWRNTKAELTEFFTELTTPPVSDFLRSNLFANTPDILHEYLQVGGRPAFLVRLALAATLGPTYGIYSGFELCERDAIPGTEEYLDSDKYQVKPRDWHAPGNIKETVSRINRLRRELPALRYNHELWFLPLDNPQLLAYCKGVPGGGAGDRVVVIVNLDVHTPQEGWVGLPLEALGLAADEPFVVHDLLGGERFMWRGEWNFVRIDPAREPAQIMVVEGRVGTEQRVQAYA